MPFPFPTPQEAANARSSAGFFDRLGSNFLHHAPYGIGPLYNAGSTVAHLIQGTAGQYGPATTPIGRLISLFTGNSGNAPKATLANPGYPSALPALNGAPSAPQGPGAFANDPTDPNNPGAYSLGGAPAGVPQSQGDLGPGGIPNSVWQQVYNTGRFTNAPAFFPSLQQAQFPGSRIGPGGTSVANPYDASSTHGTPNQVVTSIPASAAAFMAEIRARNQL